MASESRQSKVPRWLPWAGLALLVVVAVGLALWAGRETTFHGDDWDLLLYRQGFSSDVFFFPHNEHLIALQILVLKLLGAVAGLDYGAYRAALVIVDALVGLLFFSFASRRVGPWLGLTATIPLLFLGAASDSLIWPTMIGVMSSLACGLGALILLERDGTARKVGTCALLVVAVGFESNGLFFLVAVGIWLLLARRWRDLWIAVIPLGAYLLWYTSHGSSEFTSGNLAHAPRFFLDLAFAGVSGLSGVGFSSGHPRTVGAIGLVALLAAIAWLLLKARPRLSARTAGIASLPIFSWLAVALGRAEGGDPFASRYVFSSALFILMFLVEVLRDAEIKYLFRGWRAAVLLALLAISVGTNVHLLVQAGDAGRSLADYVDGRADAIDLTRRTIDQNLVLGPVQDMGNMRAGWYLNAVDHFGESPVGPSEISSLDPAGRLAADQVLAAGARATLTGAGATKVRGPAPTATGGTALRRRGECLVGGSSGTVDVTLPARGLLIDASAPTKVSLRRFAPGFFAEPSWRFQGPALLTVAADNGRRPWQVRVNGGGALRLCGAAAGRQRLLGPPLPAAGDQACEPFNLGTPECRFRRYSVAAELDRP